MAGFCQDRHLTPFPSFEPITGAHAWLYGLPGSEQLAFVGYQLREGLDWTLKPERAPLTITLLGLVALFVLIILGRAQGMIFGLAQRSGWVHVLIRTLTQWSGGQYHIRGPPAGESPSSAIYHPPSTILSGLIKWLTRYEHTPIRRAWVQGVAAFTFVACFFSYNPVHAAPPVEYDPVFYYYHSDHLGSSSVMTDREGDLVQQYQYYAYGNERYRDNGQAFNVSNRYTGQILDDETGLYYYNARYYDAEMGRFIQADTVVPEPENPQAYNRYAYAANNPLKYNDPSGNFVFTIIAAVLIGAAIGAATAAATGGNILMGALSGAVSGLFGGIGAVVQSAAVALIGGAAAGAINSAIQGGNPLLGALSGMITGALSFGVGVLSSGILGSMSDPVLNTLVQGVGQVAAGTIGGGIGAELAGGDFGQGALYGAIGGGIAFGITAGLTLIQNTRSITFQMESTATGGAPSFSYHATVKGKYGNGGSFLLELKSGTDWETFLATATKNGGVKN